jgi:hypothetical protein
MSAVIKPSSGDLMPAQVGKPMLLLSRAGQARRHGLLPPAAPLRQALPCARRALRIGGVACETAGTEWVVVAAGQALPVGPFDLVVIGHDVIARTPALDAMLAAIRDRTSPGASLVVDFVEPPPMALLQRCIDGDFSDDDNGPFARPLRYATPASLYKLLLDAGWMPDAAHTALQPLPEGPAGAALLALAAARGLPPATAARRLGLVRMIVRAQRLFEDLPAAQPDAAAAGRFAVVVPTTRDAQFSADLERSPGLAEVGARLVCVRHAGTPAQALEAGQGSVDEDWILLCHQDVYFPRGFGRRLQRLLAGIPADDREATLIGFAGLGADAASGRFVRAGFVIDRWHRFDHPATAHATSIDELALVVARKSLHSIDPSLGWHLWATDLCLEAITRHHRFARIERLPLLHNSYGDYRLPDAFHVSARRLAAKHAASFGPVPTLCGTVGVDGSVQVARTG